MHFCFILSFNAKYQPAQRQLIKTNPLAKSDTSTSFDVN